MFKLYNEKMLRKISLFNDKFFNKTSAFLVNIPQKNLKINNYNSKIYASIITISELLLNYFP